jgi:hypothetical protein
LLRSNAPHLLAPAKIFKDSWLSIIIISEFVWLRILMLI